MSKQTITWQQLNLGQLDDPEEPIVQNDYQKAWKGEVSVFKCSTFVNMRMLFFKQESWSQKLKSGKTEAEGSFFFSCQRTNQRK